VDESRASAAVFSNIEESAESLEMIVRRSLLLLAFLSLLVCFPLGSQTVEDISADFTLETAGGASRATVRGQVYYLPPEKTIVKVTDPVLQWNVFEGSSLLIYYPQDRRAFRFTSRNRLLIPFSYSFIGIVKEDFGLADADFQLLKTEARAGILISTWEPPRQVRNIIGHVVVGLQGEQPILLEIYEPKGELSVRVAYGDYFESGFLRFPGKATVVQKKGEEQVVEVYRYHNYRINGGVPPEVSGFSLPDGIEVKEIHW
jgi:hypothetical protein